MGCGGGKKGKKGEGKKEKEGDKEAEAISPEEGLIERGELLALVEGGKFGSGWILSLKGTWSPGDRSDQ